jgi:hypothetical protein
VLSVLAAPSSLVAQHEVGRKRDMGNLVSGIGIYVRALLSGGVVVTAYDLGDFDCAPVHGTSTYTAGAQRMPTAHSRRTAHAHTRGSSAAAHSRGADTLVAAPFLHVVIGTKSSASVLAVLVAQHEVGRKRDVGHLASGIGIDVRALLSGGIQLPLLFYRLSERRRGYLVWRIEPCGGGRAEVLFWGVSGTNGLTAVGCLLYFAP